MDLCPFCGEKVKNENDGCKHCGYNYRPSGVTGLLNEMDIRFPQNNDKYEEDDWQGKFTGNRQKNNTGYANGQGNFSGSWQGNNTSYGNEQENWQRSNEAKNYMKRIQDWCNLNTNETSKKIILVLLTFFAPVLGIIAGFVLKSEQKEKTANYKGLIIIITILTLIIIGLAVAIVFLSVW